MIELESFVNGVWIAGRTAGEMLIDPTLGHTLASASSDGVDIGSGLQHSRLVGVPALQALTYADRADSLSMIAAVLSANREDYLRISLENSGATAADASIDIDGSIFTLKYFARLGAKLGRHRYLHEGIAESLSKDGSFQTQHFMCPMKGVAILINAFNFPAWGLWEKAAAALLSGMPVFAKPATATALLTYRMVQDVIAANVLPPGALSLLCGSARELLDHVNSSDIISFTGSAATAQHIRGKPAVLRHSTRLNIEADSLNCALLGPDSHPGTKEFELFVREVVREMTVKAGQKCTAIRRVIVPAAYLKNISDAICAKLEKIIVGDPRYREVRMGPLVNKSQQGQALQGIAALKTESRVVFGGGTHFLPRDADLVVGAFVQPTLLMCDVAATAQRVHEVEVFGPVATLLAYTHEQQAFDLARKGGGSLVASVFSADDEFSGRAALDLSDSNGRVLCISEAVGQTQTGHGNVMPMCLHGGPGRAGGGEELGGLRALAFYHHRFALQGSSKRLDDFAVQSANYAI